MDCNYKDKIFAYIENELNEVDKAAFELKLKEDSDLNHEYLELKSLLNSLHGLPEKKASQNFMVSLNEKIDNYENSKSMSWLAQFANIFARFDTRKISFASFIVATIFMLSYYVNTNSVSSNTILSNSSEYENMNNNQVADLDSLDFDNEK